MAQTARSLEIPAVLGTVQAPEAAAPAKGEMVRLVDSDQTVIGGVSPALLLQQRIEASYAANDDERWSPRKTLAFIGLTCGAFWGAVGVVGYLLLA